MTDLLERVRRLRREVGKALEYVEDLHERVDRLMGAVVPTRSGK